MDFVAAIFLTEEGKGLLVGLEEDKIFGEMGRMSNMCEAEGLGVVWKRCNLARMEEVKRNMVEDLQFDVNGNVVRIEVEDLNSTLGQRVMTMTELALMMGERRITQWDAVLDFSWNRWRLQDMRDKVSGLIRYLDI